VRFRAKPTPADLYHIGTSRQTIDFVPNQAPDPAVPDHRDTAIRSKARCRWPMAGPRVKDLAGVGGQLRQDVFGSGRMIAKCLAAILFLTCCLMAAAWGQTTPIWPLHDVPSPAGLPTLSAWKQDYNSNATWSSVAAIGTATTNAPRVWMASAIAAAPTSGDITSGLVCDGATDNAAFINALTAAGAPIHLGAYAAACVVRSTINISRPGQVLTGSGADSTLSLILTAGAPAQNAIYVQRTATGTQLANLTVDANGSTLANPTPCPSGHFPVFGQAVLIAADNTQVSNVTIKNGWDNGLGIGYIDESCVQHNGLPVGVHVGNLTTTNNGSGLHNFGANSYRQGGAIDNLTASGTSLNGLYSNADYAGLLLDFAGGGTGTYTNIKVFGPVRDNSNAIGKVASGLCAYIGATDSSVTNLTCSKAGGFGVWIDGYAQRNRLTNVSINGATDHSLYVKGLTGQAINNTIVNLSIADPSYLNLNFSNAVLLDTSGGPITGLLIEGLSESAPAGTSYAAAGIAFYDNASGNLASGRISASQLVGNFSAVRGTPSQLIAMVLNLSTVAGRAQPTGPNCYGSQCKTFPK
jgi:hypothetical protein